MMKHNIKVLLVEDDQTVSTTLGNMLSEMGIDNVHDTFDGKEAVDFIKTSPNLVSFVICDWNMPGMSGLEVLQEIRKNNPYLPFLMITARADKGSVLVARENNVTAYICKPFSFECLKKKVTYMIDK